MSVLDGDALDLPRLLRSVAREMDRISAIAESLQCAVSELLEPGIDPGLIERLQGFDLLAQEIQELGRLIQRVSEDAGARGSLPEDILSRIKLSHLKRIFLGNSSNPVALSEPEIW
jgi:hypothetical protein